MSSHSQSAETCQTAFDRNKQDNMEYSVSVIHRLCRLIRRSNVRCQNPNPIGWVDRWSSIFKMKELQALNSDIASHLSQQVSKKYEGQEIGTPIIRRVEADASSPCHSSLQRTHHHPEVSIIGCSFDSRLTSVEMRKMKNPVRDHHKRLSPA